MSSTQDDAVTYTISGYGVTATDLLEWDHLWREFKTNPYFSLLHNYGASSLGSWANDGIDCQDTKMVYDKLIYCRYSNSQLIGGLLLLSTVTFMGIIAILHVWAMMDFKAVGNQNNWYNDYIQSLADTNNLYGSHYKHPMQWSD